MFSAFIIAKCCIILIETMKTLNTKKLFSEKNIRLFFDISLIIKGILSLFEIIGGVALYFVSKNLILRIADFITRQELSADPKDFVANYVLRSTQHLSAGMQHYASFYLLSHGAIKLFLISGLLRKRLWYYPLAILVFLLFVAYQIYKFSFSHSLWLILLTVLDIIVIILTWHEYKYLKRHISQTEQ